MHHNVFPAELPSLFYRDLDGFESPILPDHQITTVPGLSPRMRLEPGMPPPKLIRCFYFPFPSIRHDFHRFAQIPFEILQWLLHHWSHLYGPYTMAPLDDYTFVAKFQEAAPYLFNPQNSIPHSCPWHPDPVELSFHTEWLVYTRPTCPVIRYEHYLAKWHFNTELRR